MSMSEANNELQSEYEANSPAPEITEDRLKQVVIDLEKFEVGELSRLCISRDIIQ